MKKWFLYSALLLSVMFTGCSSDQFSAGNSDVVVTVSGLSAFGEWERDFVGPESQATEFLTEAAQVARAVAEKFDGTIDVDISIGGQRYEEISMAGNSLDIVPAAILAAHDMTALRFGFLPKGTIKELNATGSKSMSLPCTCIGAGCCCTSSIHGGECGNIFLSCEGCRKKDYCVGGTQCFGPVNEGN